MTRVPIAIAGLLLSACEGARSDTNGYALGHIGSVRFRVPDDALMSGMSSDVNAWLKPDRPPEPNTYERPIATFDLRLWLPDVSYAGHEGEVMDPGHRLGVTVSNFDYEANPNGPRDGLRNIITSRGDIDYPFPRFADAYGLKHWRSHNFPNTTWSNDIFFSDRYGSLILCGGDALKTGVQDFGLCLHSFNMPQYRVRVEMSYDRDWLPEWRTSQEKVARLIATFVLRDRRP